MYFYTRTHTESFPDKGLAHGDTECWTLEELASYKEGLLWGIFKALKFGIQFLKLSNLVLSVYQKRLHLSGSH